MIERQRRLPELPGKKNKKIQLLQRSQMMQKTRRGVMLPLIVNQQPKVVLLLMVKQQRKVMPLQMAKLPQMEMLQLRRVHEELDVEKHPTRIGLYLNKPQVMNILNKNRYCLSINHK
jgi:hypothetical protein